MRDDPYAKEFWLVPAIDDPEAGVSARRAAVELCPGGVSSVSRLITAMNPWEAAQSVVRRL
jgi:hypothetical protein